MRTLFLLLIFVVPIEVELRYDGQQWHEWGYFLIREDTDFPVWVFNEPDELERT